MIRKVTAVSQPATPAETTEVQAPVVEAVKGDAPAVKVEAVKVYDKFYKGKKAKEQRIWLNRIGMFMIETRSQDSEFSKDNPSYLYKVFIEKDLDIKTDKPKDKK